MPRAKRTIESATTIDGISLVWRLHREQQFSTADGWKGASIHARVAEGVRRELHLEYPAVATQKGAYIRVTTSAKLMIRAAKVEAHIREAMAAGWDPNSRGKAFVHQVEELPS